MTEADVLTMAQSQRGWSAPQAETAVRAIMQTGKWSLETLYLGFRAGFQCEYCDRLLLTSPDDYKLLEIDHIIPGEGDHPDNLALACLQCNFKFKSRWHPPAQIKAASRDVLVTEVRRVVHEQRGKTTAELDDLRQILSA